MNDIENKAFKSLIAAAMSLGLLASAFGAGTAQSAEKLSIAVPGVPPVFSTVMIYTAKGAGFYKKYGLDVTIKPFTSTRMRFTSLGENASRRVMACSASNAGWL